ncbi:MAG: hypothetical protein KIS78_26510 [Labilithrix sp.]|nr:hypothetical protein [Labilithrix sp.]MCW5835981.1 hypothetical protein [Labilithrix sp.]
MTDAAASATLPPPDDYERALQRERLDASILRALGERRAYRDARVTPPSGAWDGLELQVERAATLLWEVSTAPVALRHDLLAYCAFLARELEITERLALDPDEEWSRLGELAPRAITALDDVGAELATPRSESNPTTRALAAAFGTIRAELARAVTDAPSPTGGRWREAA